MGPAPITKTSTELRFQSVLEDKLWTWQHTDISGSLLLPVRLIAMLAVREMRSIMLSLDLRLLLDEKE